MVPERHARLDIPLEEYDEAAVSAWLDDRLVDFANAYLELHLTKQYQERVLVPDTVAGISFPKLNPMSTEFTASIPVTESIDGRDALDADTPESGHALGRRSDQ